MQSRRLRTAVPVALLVAALALAGCTGSSGSTASPSAGPSTSTSTSTSRVDPATLANTLQSGLASAPSVHLAVTTKVAGDTIDGAGDAALKAGQIEQANITQGLPSGLGTIRVIDSGGRSYAKLPPGLGSADRPWVELRSGSSNLVVSQLAGIVTPVLAVASPNSIVAFARAASSVTRLGATRAGGSRYRVIVDPAKLPASFPSSIDTGSSAAIQVALTIDSTGRPVEVSGSFTISGQPVTPTIRLSNYGEPVSITAPPADQVSTQ